MPNKCSVRYITITISKEAGAELEYWLARELFIEDVRLDWEPVAKFDSKKEWEAFQAFLENLYKNQKHDSR